MSNLSEIGQLLKETREQKGLSLEDVANATHIVKHHLIHLEEGNTLELPETFYIKSFIKKYGNYLGLDGNELAGRYEDGKAPSQSSPPPESSNWGWLPLAATIVLLAGLGVAWLASRPAKHVAIQPTPTVQPTTMVATASQEATSTVAEASPSTPIPSPTASSTASFAIQVTAAATEDCWVEVVADGETIFSKTIKKGNQVDWQAQKRIQMTFGNAGGIALKVNDKDQGVVGKTGEVATRIFAVKE